jgi:hypothetical protein
MLDIPFDSYYTCAYSDLQDMKTSYLSNMGKVNLKFMLSL